MEVMRGGNTGLPLVDAFEHAPDGRKPGQAGDGLHADIRARRCLAYDLGQAGDAVAGVEVGRETILEVHLDHRSRGSD